MSSALPEGVDLLSSPARRAIVDLIAGRNDSDAGAKRTSGLTAAELAEVLALHVTTARFHLDQLVSGGILEASFVKEGVGRPRKVYRLAQGALSDPPDSPGMRILTELLADSFGATAAGEPLTPLEAGRRWAHQHVVGTAADSAPAATPGAWLGKIGRLIDVLREWGYTPHLSTDDEGRAVELRLAQCPFLDLARSHPAVVCGIHRGLLAGTLERLGELTAEVSLEPFVGPRLCVARITTRTRFPSTTAPRSTGSSRTAPSSPSLRRIPPSRTQPPPNPSKETA